MLLRSDDLERAGYHFYVSYPVLPWFGVVALGYGVAHSRKPKLFALLLFAVFVSLRMLGVGDPSPSGSGLLSVVNLEKYPPSPDFLLMTLAGASLALTVLARRPPVLLCVFGRVPLFFYVTHIALIHSLAVVVAFARYGHAEWLYRGPGIFWSETLPGHPPGYGLSLPWVMLVWVVVLATLTPACAAYGRYKAAHPGGWRRYL
jgi:hypothetical protein